MHSPSRRLVALLAATATLAGGSLATAAQASAATPGSLDGVRTERSLIDVVVSLVLSLLGPNPTVSQIQSAVGGLTAGQLGGLLQGAGAGQLDAILGGGLNPAQLTSAVTSLATAGELDGLLDTLTAGQTGDLLAPLTGGALSGALGLLNTSQLLGALGTLNQTELGSVVDGLTSGQTGSLLSSANPAQLTSLVGGLTGGQVDGGLGVLDATQLTSLLGVANTALAGLLPGADATGLQGLIGTITSLLGAGTPPPPPPPPPPAGGTAPGATVNTVRSSGMGATAARPPAFTAYRATIGSVKVAKTRRSAKLTVSCPAAAPVGCVVTLKGAAAGRKAFAGKPFILLRKAKRTLTMKLSTTATRRLKKKGGSLKVSALTMYSTLPTSTKTVKVARKR